MLVAAVVMALLMETEAPIRPMTMVGLLNKAASVVTNTAVDLGNVRLYSRLDAQLVRTTAALRKDGIPSILFLGELIDEELYW
jgi:hypothetical protein